MQCYSHITTTEKEILLKSLADCYGLFRCMNSKFHRDHFVAPEKQVSQAQVFYGRFFSRLVTGPYWPADFRMVLSYKGGEPAGMCGAAPETGSLLSPVTSCYIYLRCLCSSP